MSHLQEAERDENDADEKLQHLKKQKDGADGKRKAELEEEEKRLNNLKRGIFPSLQPFLSIQLYCLVSVQYKHQSQVVL